MPARPIWCFSAQPAARGLARRPATDAAPALPEAGTARPFRVALLISLMNPKAILFYVSFFIQFVSPGYAHPALSFLILGWSSSSAAWPTCPC
jgi:leucine efflux protein